MLLEVIEDDEPRGWQLDWEPVHRAGAPSRLPPTDDAVYAEAPVRIAAFAIDVLLALVLGQLASQTLAVAATWWSRQPGVAQDQAVLAASGSHVIASVAMTLLFAYLWRVFRQTPGQMALRLHVLRRGTGERLSRAAALARWLVLYLPLALVMSYQTLSGALARIPATANLDQLHVVTVALVLPFAWWLLLGVSVLAERRRGRGLHDRLAGSVVVRRVSG
jgi:uncharacterized RDD family membrane protein YckC